MNNTELIVNEYKNITIKCDNIAIYVDCLSNFGWMLVDEHEDEVFLSLNPLLIAGGQSQKAVDKNEVSLMFKRNRCMKNKADINKLERICLEALSYIDNLERKRHVLNISISLGHGIIGTVILGFAVYNFISANIVIGSLLSVLGMSCCIVGFIANCRFSKKRSKRDDLIIEEKLGLAYEVCEKAHLLMTD